MPDESSQTKRCCLCEQYKPLNRFAKASSRKDGRQTACNECLAQAQRRRRQEIRGGAGTTSVANKTCAKCGKDKPATDFYVSFQSRDHLTKRCKQCSQDPDKGYRLRLRLAKYGLTVEDYWAMVAEQQNRCAICNREETRSYFGKRMLLGVDHNHDTGQPRKLLCARCNYAVGGLEYLRRSGLLDAALKYIQDHS